MEGNDEVRRWQYPRNPGVDRVFSAPDWSFQSLFDRRIDVPCPVASSSTIHLVVPDVCGYTLSPEPVSSNDTVSVYSPTTREDVGLSMGADVDIGSLRCTP